MVQNIVTFMQIILSFSNICILAYAFMRFVNKPHTNLENKHEELKKRVDEHDVKIKEIHESLDHGNDKFRDQKDLNEVFINCMLAFIDFERAYCAHTGYDDSEDLERARETLQKYLARK